MLKPLILISSQRSGTYYFLNILQQFYGRENATIFGEIFREQNDTFELLQNHFDENFDEIIKRQQGSKIEFWKSVIKKSEKKNHLTVAAKIFYYHLNFNNPLWSYFSEHPHTIVHLIRKNIFNSYVSALLAHQSGIWINDYKETKAYNYSPITIDREHAIEYIKVRINDVNYIRDRFKDSGMTEIYYEDIGVSTKACCNIIEEITGMKPINDIKESGTRKQKLLTNKELVLNYNEVADLDKYYF